MAYSNFTLDTVRSEFELEIVESAGVFSETDVVMPRERFMSELEERVQLAISIGTEKARSELIVTDVLFELREQFDRGISFFSGIDFNVDDDKGLTGVCDFLVNLSPILSFLDAPVIILVEAKKALDNVLQRCSLHNVSMQKKGMTSLTSMELPHPEQIGGFSNWKDKNSILIEHSIQLGSVTKSSVFSRVW